MPSAAQIFEKVKGYFDTKELKYTIVENRENSLKTVYSIDGKLKQATLFFNCYEDCFIVNTYITLNADEKCRTKVGEFLHRANYGLRYGCFEMDFEDGEIRYRMTTDCKDRTGLSEALVRSSISIPLHMFEKYGDDLVAVMYDIKEPKKAIEDAEKPKE